MAATLTSALKDGQYVEVSQFTPGTGIDCGCICPECGTIVGSRIYNSRESCFFHYDETSKCSGGQRETELHLEAKKIFEENNYLFLPSNERNNYIVKFHYTEVKLEQRLGKIRPDIILKNQLQELIVEIAVTSFLKTNPNKISMLKNINTPTIEINLKELFNLKESLNKIRSTLVNELIEKVKLKEWIISPDSNSVKNFEMIKKEENYNWLLIIFFFLLSLLGIKYFRKRNSR